MIEMAVALGVVVAMGLIGGLGPGLLATVGTGTLALGLLLGVPTGFWYHVVLYRVVAAKGPVPSRWWLSPSGLHGRLSEAELGRVTFWYRTGGIGFVLSLGGGVAAILGALMARW